MSVASPKTPPFALYDDEELLETSADVRLYIFPGHEGVSGAVGICDVFLTNQRLVFCKETSLWSSLLGKKDAGKVIIEIPLKAIMEVIASEKIARAPIRGMFVPAVGLKVNLAGQLNEIQFNFRGMGRDKEKDALMVEIRKRSS